jgi:TrmH family RNA methyltransferase
MISKNQIKQIQALHLKKNRELENLFIVEGIKTVNEFLNQSKFPVKNVYATSNYLHEYENELQKNSIKYTEITEEELIKISTQQTPNQVLAVVEKSNNNIDSEYLNHQINLYLDDIRDPGNLGTIIRVADWFGIKQIICSPKTTEVYNPKTIQASMGAIIRVNVIYKNLVDIKSSLNNVPLYASVLNGKNIYTHPLKKGIIIIGNEANGISKEILDVANEFITIPAAQNNGSESLNAAIACSIICSEFHRQLNFN